MDLENRGDIGNCLLTALARFTDEHGEYVAEQAHEMALCHRLGVHLERVFVEEAPESMVLSAGDLIVDLDYNRMGPDGNRVPKGMEGAFHRLMVLLKHCANKLEEGGMAKALAKKVTLVRPDLILHKRGEPGPNVLAIEAKHSMPTGYEYRAMYLKMIFYKYQLAYQHVAYVDLGSATFRWLEELG